MTPQSTHEDPEVLKKGLDSCVNEFKSQLEFAERAVGLREPHISSSGLVPEDFEKFPFIVYAYLKVRKNALRQEINVEDYDAQMCGYTFAFLEAGKRLTEDMRARGQY